MALSTVFTAQQGLGKHIDCIPSNGVVYFLRSLVAWEYLYTLSLASTKLSVIFMLRRLFNVQRFVKVFWILIALTVAWAFGSVLAISLVCVPFSAAWSNPKECHSLQALYWGIAIPNILTDLAILAAPLGFISTIQLSKTQKIGLHVVFLCGGLVVLISIIRLNVLVKTALSTDMTWTAVDECVWSIVECNIAIVSACLPTLRPLLGKSQHFWSWIRGRAPDHLAMLSRDRKSSFGEGIVQHPFDVPVCPERALVREQVVLDEIAIEVPPFPSFNRTTSISQATTSSWETARTSSESMCGHLRLYLLDAATQGARKLVLSFHSDWLTDTQEAIDQVRGET